MAESLGSAVLTLSVDDKQYNAGLQRAKQTADRTLGAVKGPSLGGSFSALTGGLAAATTAAAAAGIAVAGIGFAATQSAGRAQKLQAAFTGLTGSAEAASQLRQQLFDLSKTTPFKNEEILQASQRFLAVGVNVENLNGTLNRVGALASQAGQPLERLALIYAQVYAKGRLQGEENLQLLEAGVDLSQELAQVTGLTGSALQDAMSKGQIGIDAFNKALVLATGDMKALQQAGKAVDVQFNNIFDNLGQLFGGFAQVISPALSAAFKVINDIFDAAFPDLNSIVEFFAPLTKEAQNFADVLGSSPATIEVIAAGLKSIGGEIIQNIADGIKFVSDLLASVDQKAFIQGFINAELVVRRLFLAASALGAQLVKNAELSARALSNPIQFGKDIVQAGGFGKFIEKEYKDVERKWNAWADSEPLTFPDMTGTAAAQSDAIAGNLSNKINGALEAQKETVLSNIKLESIKEQIQATRELANAEAGVKRETLATIQAIQAGINEAKRREQEIGLQIDAARQKGDESEASILVSKQAVAAEQTRLEIEKGALALQEAGENLLANAESARNSLRSAYEGAFDLLRRSDQLELVRQARSDIFNAGVFDPAKVARLDERGLISAASSARGILEAQDNLSRIEAAYSSLSGVSQDLSPRLDALSAAVVELTLKDWNVYINTNYSGSAAQELLAAASLS